MTIFRIFFQQSLSKIFSKTHEIAPFKKKFGGACPRTSLYSSIYLSILLGYTRIKFPDIIPVILVIQQ